MRPVQPFAWAAPLALLAALACAPSAARPFPSGLFSSEKGCPSRDIHSKGEPTLLSAEGLEAIEWNCEFVQISPVWQGRGWLIDAACNAPGEFYPQQFVAIEDKVEPGPAVVRLNDGSHTAASDTVFHPCPPKR